ncbi:MAG: hypothetical protein ABH914_02535 [Candidatus Omnitrophota bacterium]
MARAVTLVELLISVCLISLVLLSAGAVFTTATSFYTSFNAQAQMQNEANTALQTMIRAVSSAKSINKISNTELDVNLYNGDTINYKLVGTRIERKINGVLDEVIARGVSAVNFHDPVFNDTTKRETIRMDLTMARRLGLADSMFSTNVTVRKYE